MTLAVSFEVFPPKTPAGLGELAATVAELAAVGPAYISVTFGAGGSQRDKSFEAIRSVAGHAAGTPLAGHLTCVGVPAHEVDAVIDRYAALGIRHVVALRGDPPAGIDAPYEPHPDGYQRTAHLVAAIKQRPGFEVSVSAYPEVHPQSPGADHDLDVLEEKVDAGADRAMTQMFFDNAHFLRYLERVRARGIDIPVVPGIFPIHSLDNVARFAQRCGATIPRRTVARFDGIEPADPGYVDTAADVAAEQIDELARSGVDHVHVYTLNRPELALAVCARLDITPTPPSTASRTLDPSPTSGTHA